MTLQVARADYEAVLDRLLAESRGRKSLAWRVAQLRGQNAREVHHYRAHLELRKQARAAGQSDYVLVDELE